MIATREDVERLEAMVAEYVAASGGKRFSVPLRESDRDALKVMIDLAIDAGEPEIEAVARKASAENRRIVPWSNLDSHPSRRGYYDWCRDPDPGDPPVVSDNGLPPDVFDSLAAPAVRNWKVYPSALDALRDLGRVLLELAAP